MEEAHHRAKEKIKGRGGGDGGRTADSHSRKHWHTLALIGYSMAWRRERQDWKIYTFI